MRILITGGAGYLGTTLIPMLWQRGHEITVLDNLMFGGQSLLPFMRYAGFEFVKGDVRDENLVRDLGDKNDAVIHLAAIVGFPACGADPDRAETINLNGAVNVSRAFDLNKRVLYASSVSVYGSVPSGVCDELTQPEPLSLYGKTKLKAEQLLQMYTRCTSFRFPTLFGVSPRMRLDLMPNQLIYEAVTRKALVIYEENVRRPFLHVSDAARALIFALENPTTTEGEIFIPGDFTCNTTKRRLCEVIQSITDCKVVYDDKSKDADGRDYEVSFEKFNKLGYKTHCSLFAGLCEVKRAVSLLHESSAYTNI